MWIRTLLQSLIWLAARLVLGWRYRVEVRGLDQVRGLRSVLILPNHPAYIDPALVLRAFWPVFRPRPMLFTDIFVNPLLSWVPRLYDAIEVPNLENHSLTARQQAERAVQQAIATLQRGGNVILWPSGRVMRSNLESLGASRSVAQILAAVPDVNIVLVRTRGLWGSRFSFAYTGSRPHLLAELLRGGLILLANAFVFTPRRRLSMTVQRFDTAALPDFERSTVNAALESWYNAPGPEQPVFVPYHFLFGPRRYEFPPLKTPPEIRLEQVDPAVRQEVAQILAKKLGRPLTDAEQSPATTLESLGLDSLDRMELSLELEQRFGFRSAQVPTTVGQLWALAQGLVQAAPVQPPPRQWFAPPTGDQQVRLLADNVPLAVLRRALVCPRDPAVADEFAGLLTYRRSLAAALALAAELRKIPGTYLGLLLPASVAADLLILATYLAGKTPVLLNWTTGPANIAQAIRLTGLTHVAASQRLLDRLGLTLETVQVVALEDLRQQIGRLTLLRALLRTFTGLPLLQRRLSRLDPDAPAVVLFTSGSEKAPKAVPLTHRNILANQRAILACFQRHLSRHHAMLGFLPPFHSFGFTVTTLCPLMLGIRLVHHPDPTDATALVRKIAAYKPTILCATPTFLHHILLRCRNNELASLQLVVVGAEKCPDDIPVRLAALAPQAFLLEGYGISECGPLVAANRPEANRFGSVGQPVQGVQVMVVDPQTFQPLPLGTRGLLLIHGENVFPGYLGEETPPPFLQIAGQRWYVSGDLVRLDPDGFIYFEGRLKRFVKAGGEMVSLPALEEPLTRRFPPTDDGPQVAVEGIELPCGRARIVLFTRQPLSLDQANAILWEAGFRGPMRLDEVRHVPHIPLLGTGKTDYKLLRQQLL